MVLIYLVYLKAEKKHDSDMTRRKKRKTQKKTTFENDSDSTIPECVSVFSDNTDSGSWKFVV